MNHTNNPRLITLLSYALIAALALFIAPLSYARGGGGHGGGHAGGHAGHAGGAHAHGHAGQSHGGHHDGRGYHRGGYYGRGGYWGWGGAGFGLGLGVGLYSAPYWWRTRYIVNQPVWLNGTVTDYQGAFKECRSDVKELVKTVERLQARLDTLEAAQSAERPAHTQAQEV